MSLDELERELHKKLAGWRYEITGDRSGWALHLNGTSSGMLPEPRVFRTPSAVGVLDMLRGAIDWCRNFEANALEAGRGI
jgi:hypothetical protein